MISTKQVGTLEALHALHDFIWKLCRVISAQYLKIVGQLILLLVWAYDIFNIVAPLVELQVLVDHH